jgi:TATA-box binding protein (TBP) (component of TFIID and TFIIIB)
MSRYIDMGELDAAWLDFCSEPDQTYNLYMKNEDSHSAERLPSIENGARVSDVPKSSDIYISTKTQIAHLNHQIDLYKLFWEIPITPYHIPMEGIIKKQMKFNTHTQEELSILRESLPKDTHIEEYIITHIDNPTGRITFKDVRKISIGLKSSDILNNRCKKKGAFYNCFVVIIRILHDDAFKEVHVKVFNTGKMEIPGIKNDIILYKVIDKLLDILSAYKKFEPELKCIEEMSYTVLINSNFNCGYYIDRSKLYEILRTKYNISCSYDACSYPGIQSVFCYDTSKDSSQQDGQLRENRANISKVSFMIFRTGSALIVGKCTENIIHTIYNFLVKLFTAEYQHVNCGRSSTETIKKKVVKKKKTITITVHSN